MKLEQGIVLGLMACLLGCPLSVEAAATSPATQEAQTEIAAAAKGNDDNVPQTSNVKKDDAAKKAAAKKKAEAAKKAAAAKAANAAQQKMEKADAGVQKAAAKADENIQKAAAKAGSGMKQQQAAAKEQTPPQQSAGAVEQKAPQEFNVGEPTVTAEQVIAELEAKHKTEKAQQQAEAAAPQGQSPKSKKAKTRYVKLLNDNGFDYCLDTQNVRWIKMPHSGGEEIADIWVRLVPDGTQQPAKEDVQGNYEYKSGSTYYLEHYYLRPKTQQIQFLSELEVTGRPDNAIKERPYSAQNWENLVPGSIEDDIYHQAMKNMPKNKLGGHSFGGKSLRDIIEDTVNISL